MNSNDKIKKEEIDLKVLNTIYQQLIQERSLDLEKINKEKISNIQSLYKIKEENEKLSKRIEKLKKKEDELKTGFNINQIFFIIILIIISLLFRNLLKLN
jgi:hypothetical protein